MDKEAREKIGDILDRIGVADGASELQQAVWGGIKNDLADEFLRVMNELGYRKLPKDKPPLLLLDEIRTLFKDCPKIKSVNDLNKMFETVAQAQRKADIKHYEEV